jgi:PAS domain S-box-containing protein
MILAVSLSVIVIGVGFLAFYNISAFKKDLVGNINSTTEVIGGYCVLPLQFKYQASAEKELKKFQTMPYVENAIVFDNKWQPFAYFSSDSSETVFRGTKDPVLMDCVWRKRRQTLADKFTFFFSGNFLFAYYPIIRNEKRWGSLCVKVSTSMLNEKIADHLFTMMGLIVTLVVFSFFLALGLQAVISNPILKLAGVSKEISEKQDYSVRVAKIGSDEIGVLYDEFNHMLEQIELHEIERNKAEAKYRNIFENASYGIFQLSPQGRFLITNPAFARILGYDSPHEVIDSITNVAGQFYAEPDVGEQFIRRIHEDGLVRDFEFKGIRKDGSFVHLSQTVHPVFSENGRLIYYEGVMEDISQKKWMEELKSARDAAEAASRAKSQFLANMSHEIRTPMNAILGFAEVLSKELGDPKHQEYLRIISASGKTLLSLINDILDLSKIEAGKVSIQLKPVSLNAVTADIKGIFQRKITQKGLNFIVNMDPQFPAHCMLDEIRIRQILFNLVGNAVKFTHSGYIKLSIDGNPDSCLPNRISLRLRVEDTGIGIAHDQQELIFEAFMQQENLDIRKYGGTGLGLSITKRLVEVMGGAISLESEVGQGSVFSVTFPCVDVWQSNPPLDLTDVPGKDSPVRRAAESRLKLSGEIVSGVLELVAILENEMMDVWSHVNNIFIFDEVEDFALAVLELGGRYKLEFLASWGDRLLSETRNYDMEHAPSTLAEFPNLVRRVSEIASEKT